MKLHLHLLLVICLLLTLKAEPTNTVSLSLRKAEDVAVENSPDLRILRSQQKIKGFIVNENWRTYFPSASVSWFRNSNIIENESDNRSQRLSLNLDQVIYDGGRRKLALSAAMIDLDLSKYDLLISINSLRYKTRNSYYNILSLMATLDILQNSIDRQSEQLKFSTKELNLGETTEIQTIQIENRLNEIELQNKQTKIALNTSIEEYKVLLRLPSEIRINLVDKILSSSDYIFKDIPESDLVNIALKSRIEFDRTKAAELQTAAEYEIAKSYYVPTLSIGGYYASTGDRYPPREREFGFNFKMNMFLGPNSIQDSSNYISRKEDTNRSLTSSTTIGIYDNLQYKRNIAQSGIDAEQAKISRKQLNDIIRIEVKKAYENYKLSWDSMVLADQNAEVFEKRLFIKKKQVELGEARRIDLAETEIFYLEAQNAKINARVRFLISISDLELAVGASLDSLRLVNRKKNEEINE